MPHRFPMRRCVFHLALIFSIVPVRGQERDASPSGISIPDKSANSASQPQVELVTENQTGAEMRRLATAFAGTWTVTEQYVDGGTATGNEVWRTGPGGVPLIQEYHVKGASGSNAGGLAVIWWNRAAKKYEGSWCSDFNEQGCTPFAIKWAGDEIEFAGVYPDGTRRVAWREVFTIGRDGKSFVQMLEMAEEGKPLERISTSRARRTDPAP